MNQPIYRVSSIVRYVKGLLERDPYLDDMLIQGEISNLKKHRSGHWYFTLKDEKTRLSCVMFASYALRCRIGVEDGMKVIVRASLSLYEPQGSMQCYVKEIRSDGLGDLYLRFEQLKRKLQEQGYFDERHKQALPAYACDLAVVSAKEGAALQDVLSTVQKRWPLAHITLYPAYVQGEQASASLIEALTLADQQGHDCILLVRGGGSIENLWGFNSEALVHCIYDLKTPIVSGVGHESDTTLADYVCDLRAPTPTGAAERVTPDIREVRVQLDHIELYLKSQLQSVWRREQQHLRRLKEHRLLKEPKRYIEERQLRLHIAQRELAHAAQALCTRLDQGAFYRTRLQQQLYDQLARAKQRLSKRKAVLPKQMEHYNEQQKRALHQRIALLEAYSPLAVIKRGYAIAQKEGRVIKSAAQLSEQEMFDLRLYDGTWEAKAIRRRSEHGEEGILSAGDGTAG